jgi:hypothetical protein
MMINGNTSGSQSRADAGHGNSVPARATKYRIYRRLMAALAAVISLVVALMAGAAAPARAAAAVPAAAHAVAAPRPGYSAADLVILTRTVAAGPVGWPVAGSSCNNRYTWCDMTLTNYVYIDVLGVPFLVDYITVRIKVDPGAVTSRLSWTVTRSPKYGYMTGLHLQAYVLCFGNQNCHNERVNIGRSGSGTFYISSPISLRGKSVAHAVSLNSLCADCVKGQQNLSVGRRTRYAACQKSSNICRYYR